MKLTSKPFSEFVGKPKEELYDHLVKEGYNLPGEKELEECRKNPPEFMKDGNWYYFFDASVPPLRWSGGKLNWSVDWFKSDWDSNDRVVLIESELCFKSICPSFNKKYEVFGLEKSGKVYGRIKNKWELFKD